MDNLVILQISLPELRQLLREELSNHFAAEQSQNNTQPDEIGGVDLAARVIGKAPATIYGLTSGRKIPHSKCGKKLYFSRNELLAWVLEGRRKTASEITDAAEQI